MVHRCTVSVRSYEIDGYGHVNNAVYLNYLEYARGEYLKDIGFDYRGCVKAGFGLWIVRIEIDYRAPALLRDELEIETVPAERKTSYGVLDQRILRGSAVCASAKVKWALVEREGGRPRRIPAEFSVPGLDPGRA
jgi:acyl-CoA thioester hydrolase